MRSDQELYSLLEAGRTEEVEAYLDQCRVYAEETRNRTSDLATQLAFEKLAETLGQVRGFRVVGPRPAEPRVKGFVAWIRALALSARGASATSGSTG